MSTRSNIFVDFNGERKQFYHHWDGYLNGVGKDLLIRMELAVTKACEYVPDIAGRTKNVYEEFLNLLEEEGSYEPEEIGLHGDIEYLYYVKFVSGEKDVVSYTKTNWQKLDDKNYRQGLETAECGEHTLTLAVQVDKSDKEAGDEPY